MGRGADDAFIIHANLDCEARWSGLALPPAVARRISLYGALLAVFAPEDSDVEIWTPAAIEPDRWLGRPATFRVGAPAHADLVWASTGARAANDRRLAQSTIALPGARVIASVDELDLAGPWVAKVPWTAAGRDRCRGNGAPTAEQRTRLSRLLAATGALVVEPWCDRICDVGRCAVVDAQGHVTAEAPHGLVVDAHGGFVGIELDATLLPEQHLALDHAIAAAGAAIARAGHVGPFAIDGFAYRVGGARRFHPLCEINARLTFGHVAHAYRARHGITRLGLAGAAPPGATLLIAPGSDKVTAWIA
jgi:hypothetical protein